MLSLRGYCHAPFVWYIDFLTLALTLTLKLALALPLQNELKSYRSAKSVIFSSFHTVMLSLGGHQQNPVYPEPPNHLKALR